MIPIDASIDGLAELAAAQDGVVRRAQLKALGVSDRHVEHNLTARRWREPCPLVIVLHNGPPTPRQQNAIAVLAGGRVCALAARRAAEAAGLVGWPAMAVAVLVPRGTSYPEIEGLRVKVHESRRFDADDIVNVWPPRVSVERALVDAAAWTPRPRTACGLVAAGVQQRLTTADRLMAELAGAGQIRHRRLIAAALTDIGGGAQAVSEIDFLRFCRRHGFPQPELQRMRRDASGRRRYLDATFRRRDGRLVRVEIDGALHLLARTYWDDMSRGNDLVIAGETVLRFPSYVSYADDPNAVAQLRRALDLSGCGDPRAA